MMPSSSTQSTPGTSRKGVEPPKKRRTKSVQWADWEMKDVMDFAGSSSKLSSEICLVHDSSSSDQSPTTIDDEAQKSFNNNALPLIERLVQTTMEISSVASRSSSQSITSCNSMEEEDDERQAALSDLITHLEDTAALLRDYIAPPKTQSVTDFTSSEQTSFLLRYQVVLVVFIQTISILLLTLFDHLMQGEKETGYEVLTRTCGSILQLTNMMLVLFATVVLSRQMLKYKVEGSFLAQTYFATVITFAGLYFVIYRFDPSSWEFSSTEKMEENIAFSQYIKMLYLSVSAATLCGAANIQPVYWYVTLLLCFQSLVNFVYFASILAQTIGNYHSYTVQVRRSSSMSRAHISK